MKKNNKRDTINLFFSAFLIIAFIVCAHFFSQFAATLSPTVGAIITILLYAVFGLLLFYATRVGDGKAVKRFSVVTLIVLVVPSLYIIIASLAPGMPLNGTLASSDSGLNIIVALASVALGYGVPYTFLSGFEIADDEEEETAEAGEEEADVLEGGIEADIQDGEEESADAEDAEDASDTVDETGDSDEI